MKKNALFFFLVLLASNAIMAQEKVSRLTISVELPVRFSVIPSTWQIYEYGNSKIYLPRLNNYRNPVYGIHIVPLYSITEWCKAGVEVGIEGSFYQSHLYYPDEYQNILMIPMMARFSVIRPKPFLKKFYWMTDASAGYNFYHSVSGNTQNGFDFEEKGGAKANLSTGFGMKISSRFIKILVGYDITGFNNKARISELVNNFVSSEDMIYYKAWYQTLEIKIGVSF